MDENVITSRSIVRFSRQLFRKISQLDGFPVLNVPRSAEDLGRHVAYIDC